MLIFGADQCLCFGRGIKCGVTSCVGVFKTWRAASWRYLSSGRATQPPNKNHFGHIKALAQSTAWSVLPYVCTLILSSAPPFDGGRLLAGVCCGACGVAVLAVHVLQPAVMSGSTVLLVLDLEVSSVLECSDGGWERESHSSTFCICFSHTGLQMGHFLQSTGRDCYI